MKKLRSLVDIKLLKFFLVGVTNTLVGWIIQFGLHNAFGWEEKAASAANYVLTSILSYFLNKHFTFRCKETGWRPVLRFALNIATCWVLCWIFTELATVIAPPFPDWTAPGTVPSWFPGFIQPYLTEGNARLVLSSVLFSSLNYAGQRLFAFRDKGEECPKNGKKK